MPRKPKYNVPATAQCGARLPSGKLCKGAKVLGLDGCKHHNTANGTHPKAMPKGDIPTRDLNTIQDVIAFLSDLVQAVATKNADKGVADTLIRCCKELISAMKERDSNSPEGVAKKRDEIMAIVLAARALSIDAARDVLISRNFELLENKVIDAQISEGTHAPNTLLIEAGAGSGAGEAGSEAT